jgi:hypothetical protein
MTAGFDGFVEMGLEAVEEKGTTWILLRVCTDGTNAISITLESKCNSISNY